jgi:hypothetical protein
VVVGGGVVVVFFGRGEGQAALSPFGRWRGWRPLRRW